MCSKVPGRIAEAKCEPCKTKDVSTKASIYCSTCDEFQCKECSDAHQIYAVMKNHELVKASESKRHLVGLKLCDKHKNDLKFFCENDDKLCCGMCAFMEHRNCKNVTEIGAYARSKSNYTDALIADMCDFQSTVTSYRSILEEKTKGMHYKVNRIPERLDAFQAKINERFDDMLYNFVKEANGVMDEKAMAITERQRQCQMFNSEIENLLIRTDQIIEKGTPGQKFIMQHKLVEIYKGYLEKEKYLASSIDNVDFELDFDKLILDSSETRKDLGHLNIFVAKERIKHEEDLQGIALECFASRDLKKSDDDDDGCDDSVPFFFGIDFLLDGRLIAADNKKKKLVLFNQKLDVIGEYKLPENPCCLSASVEDEVAVTYSGGFYIEIFFVSSENKIVHSRTINTSSSFNHICQKDENSFIAGCKNEKRFVKCLNLKGEENELNIEFPMIITQVEKFSCTYNKNMKQLIITEREQNKVYIFNLETNKKLVVTDPRIKDPSNVAIGPFDIILVVCGTGDLVQISPFGRVLVVQNTTVTFPRSICVSKDDKTVAISSRFVVNNTIYSGCLKLFKLTIKLT